MKGLIVSSACAAAAAVCGVVGVVFWGAACDGTTGFACECFSCSGSAVTLNVVDTAGNANGGDWTVEATLDGAPVDTSACDPAVRNGVNSCGIGQSVGVYEIVIRTASTTKELTARFAGKVGQDCCASCLQGESLPVVLDAE